ncbi:hypothetical protein A946_04575 [Methylacidiphilum kamchatkense Kam1]|uniref:Circularly permuted ATP-grasp superfamily protein n=1 Tax=Methylacidiphilum kamchatkense Kam1 TaxID=1202785 RepID=A0ABR4ZWU1_9BACT|nr:hypothetical protein A946_04575 [Methylacidiphilum kamchatkense Kam1]
MWKNILKNAAFLDEENLEKSQQSLSLYFKLNGVCPSFYEENLDYYIDPWPLVLSVDDWMEIRVGVEQRMLAWRRFLKDLYFEKSIFKDKVIPFEPFLSSDQYRRECVGLEPPGGEYLYIYSCEVAKEEKGKWIVLRDELEQPRNLMLSEEIRKGLKEALPQLFEGLEIMPLTGFPERMLEAFSQNLSDDKNCQIAVVAATAEDWEAAILARRMGIPMFLPSDLVVLQGKLYAKTLSGLEPINILFRRLPDSLLDPIATRCGAQEGIAGLFWCLRKATLRLINAAGCGITTDPLLQSYTSKMIRYYLGEKPLLNSLPTYPAYDPDVFSLFLDSFQNYFLKDRNGHSVVLEKLLGKDEKTISRLDCRSLVIQKKPQLKKFPSFYRTTLSHKPTALVLFGVVKNGQPELLPIMFGKVISDVTFQENNQSHLYKDVWLLQENNSWSFSNVNACVSVSMRSRIAPLSRVAESMYWMGRYLTRSMQLNHMLLTVRSYGDEAMKGERGEAFQNLLSEVLGYFVIPSHSFHSAGPIDFSMLFSSFFAGTDWYDSVVSCISRCYDNGRKIRDSLPPEVWLALSSLFFSLQTQPHVRSSINYDQRLNEFSIASDRLLAIINEHLLRNELWKFFQIGTFYEKGKFSLHLIKLCTKITEKKEALFRGFFLQIALEWILKLTSALYAYRSLYHYPFSPKNLIELLLFDRQFPRSIYFCLSQIEAMLQFTERIRNMSQKPLSFVRYMEAKLKRWADEIDSNKEKDKDNITQFTQWIEEIEKEFYEFHSLLSDEYLTHQSTFENVVMEEGKFATD